MKRIDVYLHYSIANKWYVTQTMASDILNIFSLFHFLLMNNVDSLD